MKWYGMVWSGVVWCGMVWCGVVWCGVLLCCVLLCCVVWCGVVWCGVVWCVVMWCGVVWCGTVRCGLVCSDLLKKHLALLIRNSFTYKKPLQRLDTFWFSGWASSGHKTCSGSSQPFPSACVNILYGILVCNTSHLLSFVRWWNPVQERWVQRNHNADCSVKNYWHHPPTVKL